jgi:type II secretion system protein C
LLATISGDDQVACAVIENMKSKVQDIYKAGDIINGAQIERIDRNRIILFCDGQREVLNLHITCSDLNPVEKKKDTIIEPQQKTTEFVKVISPLERDITKDHTTQFQSMHTFLEKMEITPYIINGEGKGLRIEGLDDFSLARYAGFKNGDVIQALNGQMLTNKQKAFQVLKKARTQSSLDFELLRNQREMNLSFNLK